jgi:alpha-L-fucosidase
MTLTSSTAFADLGKIIGKTLRLILFFMLSVVQWPLASAVQQHETLKVIPTPSAPQVRYQSTDFVALIHFNMATFARNGDPGCDKSNWNVHANYSTGKTSDPATFFPSKLNTTQWFDSIVGLGANIAVLTAKHGCGFCLWPTETRLPDGLGGYGYHVGAPQAAIATDVLQEFVNSAKAAGVGWGFYYSIMKNFYLCRNFSGGNSCIDEVLEGQHNLTNNEYLAIAQSQATELWTRYGDLTEVWVDSKLMGLGELMAELQPRAAGTPVTPREWCGTESGYPSRDVGPADVWSTGQGYFGNSTSEEWVDKFCDPQLFRAHKWFWEPNLEVRTLKDMIPIYHDIVGRGMVMELAFSINRDGLVDPSHEVIYKQLGDWVRTCYGTPLVSTMGSGTEFVLSIPKGRVFDRIMLQEDIILGQRIRDYTITIVATDNGDDQVMAIVLGRAVGRKRIHLLPLPFEAREKNLVVKLHIKGYIAVPQLKSFAVFSPCPSEHETEMKI